MVASAFTPGYFYLRHSPATCVTCALHNARALVARATWSRPAELRYRGARAGARAPRVRGRAALLRQVLLRAGDDSADRLGVQRVVGVAASGAVEVLVGLLGDVGDCAPGLGPGGLGRLRGGFLDALLADVDGLVHLGGEPLDAGVPAELAHRVADLVVAFAARLGAQEVPCGKASDESGLEHPVGPPGLERR